MHDQELNPGQYFHKLHKPTLKPFDKSILNCTCVRTCSILIYFSAESFGYHDWLY